MTSQSKLNDLTPRERGEYGFARIRDAAFDSVQSLWRRRQRDGMTQNDIAKALDRDAGWVSKNLRGPGNWTFRTFGSLVEALGGEAQITIRALEDPLPLRANYHAYAGYEVETKNAVRGSIPQTPVTSLPDAAFKKSAEANRPVMTALTT